MTPGERLSALRWLVRDTFRQSRASGAFWLTLGVTAACVAYCLAAGKPGGVGALQAALAEWVAGAAGTALALVWTADFLPDFLQPSAASVVMVKPAGRTTLLAGKVLGVFAFVAFHAALFVAGTWLAIGLKTGDWRPGYLLAFPLLLAHFASVFGASALLAVTTRSVVACVFGSLAFWLVGLGTNYARQLATPGSGVGPLPGPVRASIEAAYWVMPKPADFVTVIDRAVRDADPTQALPGLAGGSLVPWLSVASSLACAAFLLFAAERHLAEADY